MNTAYHNLTGKFDAAFLVQYNGFDPTVNANIDTYISIYLQQYTLKRNANLGIDIMSLDFEYGLERCTLDRFGEELEERVKTYAIVEKFWCIKGNEFYIKDA